MPHFTRMANGNIKPCRGVTPDTSNAGCVVQATDGVGSAGQRCLGVSGKSTHLPPLADQYITIDDRYHAKAGDICEIYGPGGDESMEILLELGATVSTP